MITVITSGHFCPAFPKAILTMKKGEKAKLVIQPQCMYSHHSLLDFHVSVDDL